MHCAILVAFFQVSLFQIDPCQSACLTYHYKYVSGDVKKCYIVIKKSQIEVIRDLNFWNDKGDKSDGVVKNFKQAEDVCKGISTISGMSIDKLTAEEGQEMLDYPKLVSGMLKGRIGLVASSNRDQIQWILNAAYRGSRNRWGQVSFVDLRLGFNVDQTNPYSTIGEINRPRDLDSLTKNIYNAGTCGMLLYDPGRPNRQGVVFVDCSNPYRDGASLDDKSSNIICEYDDQKDCVMIPVYPKCMLEPNTLQCMFYDWYRKSDKFPLGNDCKDIQATNRSCPAYRRHECNKPCQWAEWIEINKCPPCPTDRKVKRVFTRDYAQEAHVEVGDIPSECEYDPVNTKKIENCTCGTEHNRFRPSVHFAYSIIIPYVGVIAFVILWQ